VRRRNFVCWIGCALVLISCSNGSGSNISQGKGACGQFSSELRIEDKFGQESTTFITGEPIEFNMRITNNGDLDRAKQFSIQ